MFCSWLMLVPLLAFVERTKSLTFKLFSVITKAHYFEKYSLYISSPTCITL